MSEHAQQERQTPTEEELENAYYSTADIAKELLRRQGYDDVRFPWELTDRIMNQIHDERFRNTPPCHD
ncbi:hypothetical protein ACO2FQ_13465 [Lacticaseibacillus paracasei]|uniref:hypothetical protein n=1 Tax=Lacticaseibacillus paracasei TaxID=1597 RepID=UPI0007BF2EEB|nr:hypothetical protein [Lacticaseibacillus paracasei]